MAEKIIMKIGGSVITRKDKSEPTPRMDVIRRVAKEIKEAYSKKKMNLILIHGVGSYGHPIVKKHNLQKGMYTDEQKQAFTQTKQQVKMLNTIFTEVLLNEGLSIDPIDASSSAIMEKGELISFSTETIEKALESGMIPLLYGVPAHDKFLHCSILSGDRILSYLANKFNPDIIIHATDTDGIFTDDPKKNPAAFQIKKICGNDFTQVEKYLRGSSNTDVTGGMKNKVEEIMSLETNSEIINGLVAGNIRDALLGKRGLGTSIEISNKVAVQIPILSSMGKRGQDKKLLVDAYLKICRFLGLK